MKKPTFSRVLTIALMICIGLVSSAQNYVPFTPRFNQDLKGDIVLIGNNILGPDNNAFNDGSVYNHNVNMQYIDIDGDPSTFSSSSADLEIPNPNCYRIIYAGLYWGAVNPGDEPITTVKLRGPSGGYNDITGTIVYDANGTTVDGGDSFSYACFADVTNIVTSFGPGADLGTYTVANISSGLGETATFNPYNGTGQSAGWSLFIVYEDPTLPGKSITSFDGFSAISVPGNNPNLDIPVSGFRTVPAPAPVRANFAFATLEGDSPILGDRLRLNGVSLSTTDRPVANFFNSSVTRLDATPVTNRVPNSTNTLGFDTGTINIPNPGNSVIANDATSGIIRLETSGDTYFPYFFAFAVEIIEPNIVLTKIVEDDLGNDIGGQTVDLGAALNYVIGFQNTGNDNATNFQIRDILPINIIFDYPSDLILPPGVTVASYDPVTRELIFNIDNSLVEENDPVYEIRIEVQVVDTCSELADACSNIINNQAYATYNGFFNPTFQITDDPSLNSNTGCLFTPQATNFLADLDCEFIEEIILCGDTVELTAADGYDSYTWSTSPTGTPVIGNTQTITVDATGTYYSFNNAIAPCQSIEQQYEVELFGGDVENPVIPYADEVVTCPNDGKLLPNIFLCGANDSRLIETNIANSTSIIWEQLDETSCAAVTDPDCANEDDTCVWNEVVTGSDFLANTSGQFRLTINYPGGCFNQFYFNVYQNLLVPTVVSTDIICTTNGSITVNDVPSGYEYSIDGTNYQNSNVFSVTTPGTYSVYVRQIGVPTNPCIFSVPDVLIRDRDFTVTSTVLQPLCYGDKGSIQLAANDVDPQYTFTLSEGGTLVNTVGPIVDNTYLFENLNPGTYTATVETENGCLHSEDITIIEPPLLTVSAALTTPLNCTDGEITIYPQGGTPPYFYFINGSTDFQTVPEIIVTASGTFDITVVDSNNCSASTTITVDDVPEPDFNITSTDILCGGTGDTGTITINVINPNGNTIEYSIDGGSTYTNSNVFTGLVAGDYNVVLQYTLGTSVCTTDPQTVTITENTAISGTAELSAPYNCNTNGTITVTNVIGGNPPYEYSIDGTTFQTNNTFTDLTQGTYTIIIRDDNDCTAVTNEITIDVLNPPTDLEFANTPVTCPAITSDITVTNVVGGTGSIEYQIIAPASAATPYQASNVFSGLAPDTYTFQVRDENDCIYSESYTIDPIPAPTVNVVLTEGLDCTATPDAEFTGSITGTSPYTYAVSINGSAYSSLGTIPATFVYNTSTAGTYQFQITDANGCIAESSVITVNPITPPSFSAVIESEPILCNGDANGAIDITIDDTVGTPPFTINVNNDTTSTDYGTQTSGLPAGTYTITITDANSCSTTETITIAQPDPITFDLSKVDITCNNPGGSSLGSITVENVSGGTAPFTYFISNNFNDVITGNPYNATSNEDYTFNIINFGIYTINVVDANGCSLSQQITIASPPSDLDINVNIAVPDCTVGGTAEVTAISAVGSGSYEFGILEFNTIPYTSTYFPPDTPGGNVRTFTNLIPGVVYTFVVHDMVTDCYYVKSADTAIDPASTLTSTVEPNNVSCLGADDGSVTFTIDNFDSTTTSVDYAIYSAFENQLVDGPTNLPVTFGVPETVTTPNPGTLQPGQYYIVFTENGTGSFNGCNSASEIFEIIESAVQLDLTVSVDQNANCNPNSGVISAIGQNGTAPYEYQITTTPAAPLVTDAGWDLASVFNVDAGSYYIHVLDAFGCIVSSPVTIIDMDDSPVISATVNNLCEITDGNYEIDITLDIPSTAPYSFSIDGGAFQTQTASFTISNLFAGTHTIEIQDANGCGNLVSIDIDEPIDVIAEATAMPSCNNDDGEITITGTGGSGSYNYNIAPNPASISLSGNVFSGVPSGVYTITIIDTVTSCTTDVTISVPEATLPLFTLTSSSVTCFGDNTGTFDINITNYTGAYTYEVFDSLGASVTGVVNANTSTNPLTVTGMTAGTFSVVITETEVPFCSNTSNVIITSPQEALTLTLSETSNVTCDNSQGTITAVADGGWGDYEFELTGDATVPYSTNNTFTDLSAGTYTVNVRDAEGCITSEMIILNEPNPITATFTPSTTMLSCFGDQDASITIDMVSGGQGSNYVYTLNTISPVASSSGPQLSNVFNDLGAGTYTVTITDGFDCEMTSLDIVIANPNPLDVNLVRTTTQTCLTESTLTLSASGGTGPYAYSDSSTFTNILGNFASSITFSVTEGTYAYYVRDANGCISNVSNDITVDPLPELVINLESSNPTINCAGDNTGSIIATAQGGLGGYSYTLEDGSGVTIPATQNSPGYFTELVAGTYIVMVESGDCDTTSAPITITEPSTQLDATIAVNNITCAGGDNGSVVINATGGTGIIQYAISPQLNQFFQTNTFENLAAGDYSLIVQDELGCYLTFDFTIQDPEPVILTIVPDSLFPELCENDGNGEFSIDISGGNLPYSVSLDNYDGPYITGSANQTVFDFTNLEGGDHIVYVRDAEGCESEWNITFPEPVIINPEVDIEYICENNTQSNIVTVTIDESNTDLSQFDYSLDGGDYQLSNVFENVPVGTDHYIDVRHTNGCVQRTELFDIEGYVPITLTLTEGELNEIIANASGGTGIYEFTMNGENYGTSSIFTITETGLYVVTVTDSAGCVAEAQIELEFVGPCIPNWFTPNGDGEYDTWAPGCVDNYPNLTFDIFDRYGRKVATYRVGEVWDGRYNGEELPTGDYWFVVKTNASNYDKEFVGHFTLYR
ncbi:T9SS type B sorting domain-containing protein [uncultured Winogradskyella sp.]|uniref:T9SS type B sorting domain-containing protein n=1 Tax=uncultured Winogradskyella sp. TaxID=395353 RepID=UPI002608331E|nr:T9SS type B sorting domain-containing protein [uncultured Winogradskyella sp.]